MCLQKGKESFIIFTIRIKIPFKERNWEIPLLSVGQGSTEEGGCSVPCREQYVELRASPESTRCWARRDWPLPDTPQNTSLTATKLTDAGVTGFWMQPKEAEEAQRISNPRKVGGFRSYTDHELVDSRQCHLLFKEKKGPS